MPKTVTALGRTRYSYKSQLEFLRGRIETEKARNDEDTLELILMYECLIDSVNQAMQVRHSILSGDGFPMASYTVKGNVP